MNTTLQFGQLVAATLASTALALGVDWVLLCAAFRLMRSAPAQWRTSRQLVAVRAPAQPHETAPRKQAA